MAPLPRPIVLLYGGRTVRVVWAFATRGKTEAISGRFLASLRGSSPDDRAAAITVLREEESPATLELGPGYRLVYLAGFLNTNERPKEVGLRMDAFFAEEGAWHSLAAKIEELDDESAQTIWRQVIVWCAESHTVTDQGKGIYLADNRSQTNPRMN